MTENLTNNLTIAHFLLCIETEIYRCLHGGPPSMISKEN